jgi:GT2 family glycosyltransferase/glycosyltransferase involved in cell wall biosynthesis
MNNMIERVRRRQNGVVHPGAAVLIAPSAIESLRRDLAAQRDELRRLARRIHRAEKQNRAVEQAIGELKASLNANRSAAAGAQSTGTTPPKPRMPETDYRAMVEGIRRAVSNHLPRRAKVLVVSKGDDELLRLAGRSAGHFPQRDDGVYLGHYPADVAAAVAHLEVLRAKGAQYLLFPRTAVWWLGHYAGLGEHLAVHATEVCDVDDCIIYKLRRAPGDSKRPAATLRWTTSISAPPPSLAERRLGVREATAPPSPAVRQATAAVVVCVHNAPEDVRRCLESLSQHPSPRSTLILIDDGSNEPTRQILGQFARANRATLIRNEKPRGYTRAANQGLRRAMSGAGHDYAVLLNSDTIVTPGWLDRIIACGESDGRIVVVGPLSNTASWQSVPEQSENGDWAANPLPADVTPAEFAALIERYAGRLYPRMGFLNGFCLAIKRSAIRKLGYFDGRAFGRGYGEENDFCLRARRRGWELAVADDAYVYHAQSRSYSHDRRRVLCDLADRALAAKHGREPIEQGVSASRDSRVMHGIRARARVMLERHRLTQDASAHWGGRRVIFLLPSTGPNGGCNVVLQEAAAMRAMGVDAQILNLAANHEQFGRNYPESDVPVIYSENEREFPQVISSFDAAIATINNSVAWMRTTNGRSLRPRFVRGYYVQDYEPYFYVPGSEAYRTAIESYTLFDDLVRVTKTRWNRDVVHDQLNVDCHIIGPSVDIDLYRARRRTGLSSGHVETGDGDVVRVAAMIRPSTPRRSPGLTMEVLRDLTRACGDRVEVVLFGCDPGEADFSALPQDFPWRSAGVLNRRQAAWLLNEIDVFLDSSSFQAMGLTALEAMACGAAVVVPRNGGTASYARQEENCLVVDSSSPQQCLDAARRLVEDRALRDRLGRRAVDDVCAYFPERAAYNILESLFASSAAKRRKTCTSAAECRPARSRRRTQARTTPR